ncbi:MAG: hypothetical protein U9Q74_00050 [Gemmatimonadota bacterium]|nr:hypothetical protein [Gemmatimonadota bacterium]
MAPTPPARLTNFLIGAALAWACGASAVAAILVQAVPLLLLPPVLCALPFIGILRGDQVATVLLALLASSGVLVFSILGAFSVGGWYLPSAGMLALSWLLAARHSRR